MVSHGFWQHYLPAWSNGLHKFLSWRGPFWLKVNILSVIKNFFENFYFPKKNKKQSTIKFMDS